MQVDKWVNANVMSLNFTKTNYVIFSYRKEVTLSNVRIGFNDINEVPCAKLLGLHIDRSLTFCDHVAYIFVARYQKLSVFFIS